MRTLQIVDCRFLIGGLGETLVSIKNLKSKIKNEFIDGNTT